MNESTYVMEEQILKDITDPNLVRLLVIATGIVVIWLIVMMTRKLFLSKIKDPDLRYRSKKLGSFTGFFLTILFLLVVFREQLGGLTIAFGVMGAGIAFALQEVIASFAGWLAIMLGGFYRTGDRVQLGGTTGDVMDIGVLRTTIMETGQWISGDQYNGRIVFIANSFVFKEPVYNYSGDFRFLWDEIKIPVRYGSDYAKARELLEKAGNDIAGDLTETSRADWIRLQYKYRLEDARTEPQVSVVANDNWVEFTLRYVVNYKQRRATRTLLYSRILADVEATQGKVKFASSSFRLSDLPELSVRLKNAE